MRPRAEGSRDEFRNPKTILGISRRKHDDTCLVEFYDPNSLIYFLGTSECAVYQLSQKLCIDKLNTF